MNEEPIKKPEEETETARPGAGGVPSVGTSPELTPGRNSEAEPLSPAAIAARRWAEEKRKGAPMPTGIKGSAPSDEEAKARKREYMRRYHERRKKGVAGRRRAVGGGDVPKESSRKPAEEAPPIGITLRIGSSLVTVSTEGAASARGGYDRRRHKPHPATGATRLPSSGSRRAKPIPAAR